MRSTNRHRDLNHQYNGIDEYINSLTDKSTPFSKGEFDKVFRSYKTQILETIDTALDDISCLERLMEIIKDHYPEGIHDQSHSPIKLLEAKDSSYLGTHKKEKTLLMLQELIMNMTRFFKQSKKQKKPKSMKKTQQRLKTAIKQLNFRKKVLRKIHSPKDNEDLENRWSEIEKLERNISERNIRLVISIAKNLLPKGAHSIMIVDLVQQGILGLYKAIDYFNPDNGTQFSSYASYWIKQAISNYAKTNRSLIHVPLHVISSASKIEQHVNEEQQYGRRAITNNIANNCSLSPAAVSGYQKAQRILPLSSINNDYDDKHGNLEVAESQISKDLRNNGSHENDVRTIAEQHELRSRMTEALATLTFREKTVIQLRYGLKDGFSYTLVEVGKIFKISRERIRQIEITALQKLQQPERIKVLKGCIDDGITPVIDLVPYLENQKNNEETGGKQKSA